MEEAGKKRLKKNDSGKERSVLIAAAEMTILRMSRDWHLSLAVRESFISHLSEAAGTFSGAELKRLRKQLLVEPAPEAPESRGSGSGGLFSAKRRKIIFGAPLRPRRGLNFGEKSSGDDWMFPKPVRVMITLLGNSERCLNTEGIFRLSGDVELIAQLREKIESGAEVNFAEIDPISLGALFKLYLRNLPEPLATFDTYSIVQTTDLIDSDTEVSYLFYFIQIRKCKCKFSFFFLNFFLFFFRRRLFFVGDWCRLCRQITDWEWAW